MALLCVEDQPRVLDFLGRGLREEGFLVREARTAPEAETILAAETIDLVLLDWMLPGSSGLELLRGLRRNGRAVPVIMVTARDALEDRLAALNAGADDYVIKPFSLDELLARMRAVLRRVHFRAETALRFADLTLDPASRRVLRADQEIRLTRLEFSLLEFLLVHAEQVVTRAQIMGSVWGEDFETSSNLLEVYIRYLRLKVDGPFEFPLIHTARGVGYVLRHAP